MLENFRQKLLNTYIIDPQNPSDRQRWIMSSYVEGILSYQSGESYRKILGYFFPEFVTALLLYACIPLIDAHWIANLQSTSIYATVGVTNTLIHFIIKAAEGLSVGTVILTGHYNGQNNNIQVGKTVASAFWTSCFVGGAIASMLFFGAPLIYTWYGVPEKMMYLGVPFLRLKSIGLFFMFVNFAFIGFLRGIKKPRVPMQIFVLGAIMFLGFDYALIHGAFGAPTLGLMGSAWASLIQYGTMLLATLLYVIFDKTNRKYGIALWTYLGNRHHISLILHLSWPVILDKITFAAAYIWLGYLINPMGKYAIASYSVIKDLERLAIQPAAAFSQVITFLVSNAYSIRDWQGIKTNIKKTVFLSSLFVFATLAVFSWWPAFFISIFDQKGKFTAFSASIFPMLSVLVFFDLLQLVLSGALRGAANVKTVMLARLAIFLLYFVPVSRFLAGLTIENQTLKFLLIYGSFYVGNGLMSLVYIYRFRGNRWKGDVV